MASRFYTPPPQTHVLLKPDVPIGNPGAKWGNVPIANGESPLPPPVLQLSTGCSVTPLPVPLTPLSNVTKNQIEFNEKIGWAPNKQNHELQLATPTTQLPPAAPHS